MAFSEFELKRIDVTVGDLCRRISPAHGADQLRYAYEVAGHAVSVFEERPPWDGESGPWTQLPIARFRYYRSRNEWMLYWMASDMKWYSYEPADELYELKELVALVEHDEFCAFFG